MLSIYPVHASIGKINDIYRILWSLALVTRSRNLWITFWSFRIWRTNGRCRRHSQLALLRYVHSKVMRLIFWMKPPRACAQITNVKVLRIRLYRSHRGLQPLKQQSTASSSVSYYADFACGIVASAKLKLPPTCQLVVLIVAPRFYFFHCNPLSISHRI